MPVVRRAVRGPASLIVRRQPRRKRIENFALARRAESADDLNRTHRTLQRIAKITAGAKRPRKGSCSIASSSELAPPARSLARTTFVDASLLGALMLAHLAIVVDTLRQKSPTVDEVAHLPAGLSYLEKRTFKMYHHSPPLGRLIPALAARGVAPPLYYGQQWTRVPTDHWQFAFIWLITCIEDAARQHAWLTAFTHARMAVAVWSALTIPMLWIWGRRWFGPVGGWVAAALWALSPNVVAHAGLTTTDIAAASSTALACFAFVGWLDRPGPARALGAGVALAAAQLVKFSALWLYALLPFWWFFARSKGSNIAGGRGLAGIYLTSLFVVNAGYLFEGTGTPIGKFAFVCDALTRPRVASDGPPDEGANRTYNEIHLRRTNRFRDSLLGWVPCPLPYHYVAGFDEQKFEADGKYQMYLNGDLRHGGEPGKRVGWWYFYLFALAVKEPLGSWLLVGAGTLALAWRWRSEAGKLLPLVALTVVPLATISFLTDICIGVRYVLPIFPFAYLLAGGIGVLSTRWIRVGLPLLALAWNAWSLAAIHPNELAYFNEWAGGPAKGRFSLIDSNLDWGQDLRSLARWLKANPDWEKSVRIAYMGTTPPEFEGIANYQLAPRDPAAVPEERRLPNERADPVHAMGPQPGKFAVSVNLERGMQFHQPIPLAMVSEILQSGSLAVQSGSQMIRNPHRAFAYFQLFEPRIEPRVGYSILLYDISVRQANAARQALGLPLLPEPQTPAP